MGVSRDRASSVRRAVARRLSYSFHTSVPVALMREYEAGRLVERYRASRGSVSITSLVVRASALALRSMPGLNALYLDGEVRPVEEVNIAVAMQTSVGLYAPVIKRADTLTAEEVEGRLAALREKIESGRVRMDDLTGHTFTVTNLGPEGVAYFTPIINPPAICILGVGAIVVKPRVQPDGAVSPGPVGHLTLVFDHRAVDGGPAAAFLSQLVRLLENPDFP